MTSTVRETIDNVMKAEGWDKYTNDPSDRGGPTKWGITEATARAFGYKGDMRALEYGTAFEIYFQRFWVQPKFDQIDKRNHELALTLFDYGVNSGQSRAAKALQRSLNVLNNQGKSFPDINADGAIGALTLAALDAYIKQRGDNGISILIDMVKAIRSVFLIELAERSPNQERFMFGWQDRVF